MAEIGLKVRDREGALDTLRSSIRINLDPVKKHSEIDGETAAGLALEYRRVQIEYLELLATQLALKEALGR